MCNTNFKGILTELNQTQRLLKMSYSAQSQDPKLNNSLNFELIVANFSVSQY